MRFNWLMPPDAWTDMVGTAGRTTFLIRLRTLNDTVEIIGTREQLAELARAVMSVTGEVAP